MSVRSLLKDRRSALGLSQAELASRAEITVSAYKQYETERVLPPLDKAIRIAKALNFDPTVFFAVMGASTLRPETPSFDSPINQDITLELSAPPAFEALQKVRNLADWKGVYSRHLPDAVASARTLLSDLDVDELEELAVGFELDVALTSPDELREMPIEQRNKECAELIPRILVVALYGNDIEAMNKDQLEAVHDAIAELTYRGKPFIYSRGLISENATDYLYRLRWQVCAGLLDALAFGKPLFSLTIETEEQDENDEN